MTEREREKVNTTKRHWLRRIASADVKVSPLNKINSSSGVSKKRLAFPFLCSGERGALRNLISELKDLVLCIQFKVTWSKLLRMRILQLKQTELRWQSKINSLLTTASNYITWISLSASNATLEYSFGYIGCWNGHQLANWKCNYP